jgi:hypothetical protein
VWAVLSSPSRRQPHLSVPLPRPRGRAVVPGHRTVAPSGRARPPTTETSLTILVLPVLLNRAMSLQSLLTKKVIPKYSLFLNYPLFYYENLTQLSVQVTHLLFINYPSLHYEKIQLQCRPLFNMKWTPLTIDLLA